MKKILGLIIGVFFLFAYFGYYLEYQKNPPGNLNVFVIDKQEKPEEFYSSPHAYRLIQQGNKIAKMPLNTARDLQIPMANESKDDFLCFHNAFAWWLIDRNLWPNYCRWNNKGEWQNSDWPYFIEAPLRTFGVF